MSDAIRAQDVVGCRPRERDVAVPDRSGGVGALSEDDVPRGAVVERDAAQQAPQEGQRAPRRQAPDAQAAGAAVKLACAFTVPMAAVRTGILRRNG